MGDDIYVEYPTELSDSISVLDHATGIDEQSVDQ